MKRLPALVLVLLAACGREGSLVSSERTPPRPESTALPTQPTVATASPPTNPQWTHIFASGLKVSMALDKKTYAVGEPVNQTVEVVNVTSQPITLTSGCPAFLKILRDETWWGGRNECVNEAGSRQGTAPNESRPGDRYGTGEWFLTYEPGAVHTRTLRWDQRRDQRCGSPNCNDVTPPEGTQAPPGTYEGVAELLGNVCPEAAGADPRYESYGSNCDQPGRYAFKDGCPLRTDSAICAPRLEFRIVGTVETPMSGVLGSVTHGPVCGYQETGCEGRPINGAYVVATDERDEYVNSASSDDNGKFKIALPPGTYRVGVNTRSYSRCSRETLPVQDGSYTPVHLTCDAGEPGT